MVFNDASIRRKPAMVFAPENEADVSAAIAEARRVGRLCVRAGGHGGGLSAFRDDAVMVDMRRMNRVKVNRSQGVMRLSGGALNGEIDSAAERVSLLAVTGSCSTVGYTSLLLGGGNTFVSRKYGLACDNLVRCTLLTPSGERLVASENENPDLWWAIRGAGAGNFGIVTEMEIKLHKAGSVVVGGIVSWADNQLETALQAYHEGLATGGNDFSGGFGVRCGPDKDGAPGVKPFVLMASIERDKGDSGWQPIKRVPGVTMSKVEKQTFWDFQRLYKPSKGKSLIRRSWFLRGNLDAEFRMAFTRVVRAMENTSIWFGLEPLGGAVADVPAAETAFCHRDRLYLLQTAASWTTEDARDRAIEALELTHKALSPWLSDSSFQSYVDGKESDLSDVASQRQYFGDGVERLRRIKTQLDPNGLLHGLVRS